MGAVLCVFFLFLFFVATTQNWCSTHTTEPRNHKNDLFAEHPSSPFHPICVNFLTALYCWEKMRDRPVGVFAFDAVKRPQMEGHLNLRDAQAI